MVVVEYVIITFTSN